MGTVQHCLNAVKSVCPLGNYILVTLNVNDDDNDDDDSNQNKLKDSTYLQYS